MRREEIQKNRPAVHAFAIRLNNLPVHDQGVDSDGAPYTEYLHGSSSAGNYAVIRHYQADDNLSVTYIIAGVKITGRVFDREDYPVWILIQV